MNFLFQFCEKQMATVAQFAQRTEFGSIILIKTVLYCWVWTVKQRAMASRYRVGKGGDRVFGELEQLVTQRLLDIVSRVARSAFDASSVFG